jgi:hypothetical protein
MSVGLNGNFDAADRFAEIAVSIMRRAVVDVSRGTKSYFDDPPLDSNNS